QQPVQPTVACYETATFNTEICDWVVSGQQPVQPTVACYETAVFNEETCAWEVSGEMPAQPTLACYESAEFNTQTCEWDVTGEPNAPIVTEAVECDSYTWSVNGITYAESGQYTYFVDCQDYILNLAINSSTSLLVINQTINEGEIFVYDGISYSVQGTYNINGLNEFGCPAPIQINLTVIPTPPGDGCYAVAVVDYNQGLTKLGTPVNPERSIVTNILGAPDGQNPAIIAPVQNFFSLGFGGYVIASFGEPIANGPGADIKIWESSASPNAERARVEVSQDGVNFFPVGEVSMTGTVDFGHVFNDYVLYVKVVDISNPAQFSNNQVSDGYDVDALECLHGKYIFPGCYATTVVSTKQGKTALGNNVPAVRSNAEFALGEPKPSIVGTVNFYSLGFGGDITLKFDYPIANGPGHDLRVGEVTWNYTCGQYPEIADVFASQDGVNFVYLGSSCHGGTFDLGPLSWALYVKIVDASDASLFPQNNGSDGYDVSGVECLNGIESNPGDDGLVGCSAQTMIDYSPGLTKINTPISANRNDPSKALGLPQNDDSFNFVSLGFGGSLTLRFDYVIFNQPGDDIQVIETSFGNPKCNNYPEHAKIAVSMDNINYVDLGEICLDGTVDLGSVPYTQYVRITDISNKNSSRFASVQTSDGYDVDAVLAIGYCFEATPRFMNDNIERRVDAVLQPNPAKDFTVLNLTGTNANENWNIQIMDAAGRLLMNNQFKSTDGNTQYRIDVQDFAMGVYLVVASNGDQKIVQRLVR
ncbi:MAG: T9SS type A sorting domain-containing protein, partial [Flavobacteriales bacterium]